MDRGANRLPRVCGFSIPGMVICSGGDDIVLNFAGPAGCADDINYNVVAIKLLHPRFPGPTPWKPVLPEMPKLQCDDIMGNVVANQDAQNPARRAGSGAVVCRAT